MKNYVKSDLFMSYLKEMETRNFTLNILCSGLCSLQAPEITNLFLIDQVKLHIL